ncbi:universal stress protein UspA [Mycobacterium sp. NS-7484]|uniref:universal stress protein n=1 Tax=unclassified Mycobacterium TaxID=2642494 RepID=UPI0007FECC5D|nr:MULTISPECIES: universal stress protein [unclassified Mycobacterium]OBG80418.1 universal stress protein UspA [Mycobacterium sp. E802]OMC02217.1 universal stress protein UspA [Mycobacterium sp. NS-7484]
MNLVVGYLATPGGADALALAVRFARALAAQLHICLVIPPDTAPAGIGPKGGYEDMVAEQAQGWLDDAMTSVPDDVVAHTHLSFDESFTDGLIHEALRLQAVAIVVGGSGGGLVGSFSLGSVVNELLHSSPVPVAVAPRGTRDSTVERIHEITCAIGQRQGSDLLLDTAVRASRAAGVPLRLVSLVALDPAFGSLRGDDDAVREHALAHAQSTLETARSELPEDFPVTSTIVNGPTVESAVEQLSWQDGDIIMVGSSRLSAPRRIFLGSTAAKMLRVLDVPMVVVPRDELKDGEGHA